MTWCVAGSTWKVWSMTRFDGAVGATRSVPPALRPEPVQQALQLDTVIEGETVTYKFTLPFLPPSKNVFDGWMPQWKSSAKKKWQRHVTARCRELGIPLDNPKVGLAAKLYFATNNRRDPQNYSQCLWNWVPDSLTPHTRACKPGCDLHAGVLRDDNQGRIDFGPNLGVKLCWDRRSAPKNKIERTVIAVTVRKAVPRV